MQTSPVILWIKDKSDQHHADHCPASVICLSCLLGQNSGVLVMCTMKWDDWIVHLAHYKGAPEDKIEFDNNGNAGPTEHLQHAQAT